MHDELDGQHLFTRVNGKRFDSGELVKQEFKHRLPSGFQSYVLNTRREKFKDLRVRKALNLAVDREAIRLLRAKGFKTEAMLLDNFTIYRAEIVPELWLLTRKAQSRIFQRKMKM